MKISEGKVVILATGGTIAGVGDAGKTAGYKPGSLIKEPFIPCLRKRDNILTKTVKITSAEV